MRIVQDIWDFFWGKKPMIFFFHFLPVQIFGPLKKIENILKIWINNISTLDSSNIKRFAIMKKFFSCSSSCSNSFNFFDEEIIVPKNIIEKRVLFAFQKNMIFDFSGEIVQLSI